ncbi:MAG: hypothetical protein ACKO1U_07120 [Bacteroidota bacterium]
MKKNGALLLVFALSLIGMNRSFAQKAKAHALTADEAKLVKKDAGTYFTSDNYNAALKGYEELRKSAPENVEYNYRLGVCYLMTNSDKTKALEPLEFVSNSKDPKKEVWYYLGMAHLYRQEFDQAIESFNHFKTISGAKLPKDLPSADRMIEYCSNGKELVSKPVDVTFTNPGKVINTPYEEYNPMISADRKQLVFTSRRKGNIGGYIEDLGMYSADVYWTSWKDTVWSKPKGLGAMVNTDWDEECVGISPDGNQLFIYFDNIESYADIGRSSLKGKMWQRAEMLNDQLNSKGYEGGACISLDGNTIIFSSIRKEGSLGGSDLYMIRKESAGNWSTPVNLGNTINTKYDEDAPALSIDGKTLFFASKGWNSMGGFDIFRSEWDASKNTWSEAVNIGYPINDADDNVFFSFTGDGRDMYISSSRTGGLGDKDIYRVTFNDSSIQKRYVLIQGAVASLNGGRPELTRVSLLDADGAQLVDYKPSYATGSFLVYGKPGTYKLHLEGYHFAPLDETVEIPTDATEPVIKNISVTLSK